MKQTIIILLAIFTILIVGCQTQIDKTPINTVVSQGGNANTASTADSSISLQGTQEIKKFSSIEEMQQFLAESMSVNSYGGISLSRRGIAMEGAKVATSAPMADSATSGSGGSAVDYSQTNVQIKGVDEGDYIKNDGKYIYILADNKLLIIDADTQKILSTTKMPSDEEWLRASEIFIYNNRLVLFAEGQKKSYYFQRYDIMPQQTYKPQTDVFVYDISDKSTPNLKEKYNIDGSYFSSRLIKDKVYVVTQEGTYYGGIIEQPMIAYASKSIRPDIYYFDNHEENYNFNTIVSIDVDNDAIVDSKTFLLGYSNTLMVSEDNIYIAYQKSFGCWGWRCRWYGESDKERFYSIILPALPADLKSDITNIKNKDLKEDEEWSQISVKLQAFFSDLETDSTMQTKYQDLFDNIEQALSDYDTQKALEQQETVIHKIGINDGIITYANKASVSGRLLNQFSMDENNGYLRVATTVSAWTRSKNLQYNNVYILDKNMQEASKLTNIAENETIYSTRFVGNKLYMVTYRQVDPFFVIDLTPTHPKVLGKLKIPGYSTYLHPVDENHLIGIGRETEQNEFGGTSTKGVKISLFDVSDFNNPKEVDKVEIGEVGSDSPALHDHKAFLYSDTKKILVLPVSEITQKYKTNMYSYGYKTWNGAYVFKVSNNGFEQIGKVKHSSQDISYYNWWDQASVMRSLYMDNKLFTVSNKYIKVNDLDNNLSDLGTIELPYSGSYAYQGYDLNI